MADTKKTDEVQDINAGPKKLAKSRIAKAGFQIFTSLNPAGDSLFAPGHVDRMSFDNRRVYRKIVQHCRFFYRHDPLAATVINKMVDMAINDLVIQTHGKASVTEESIFNALKEDLIPFLRKAAYEYLITGLVVPEIRLTRVRVGFLRDKGIKRLQTLLYPTEKWLRDSADIKIQRPFIGSGSSYFVVIDDMVQFFIQNEGEYPDGSKDTELYLQILRLYPDFVGRIRQGQQQILLDNPLTITSTTIEDSPYPIPYLYPALESLKHKRNLRRMDYSLAARVISAILHVKIGSDEYPLTEDQDEFIVDLEQKFNWTSGSDLSSLGGHNRQELDRLFALFTNHTVNIEWIFPEMEALLNDDKYNSVNQDIMVALGFPRILITGETERSFASDPQIATISPLASMEYMRNALLPIVRTIYREMRNNNRSITLVPDIIKWRPINLMSMSLFFKGLTELYNSGNLSRQSYDEAYGFELTTELENRVMEKDLFEEMGLEDVAPSNLPGAPNSGRPTGSPED